MTGQTIPTPTTPPETFSKDTDILLDETFKPDITSKLKKDGFDIILPDTPEVIDKKKKKR